MGFCGYILRTLIFLIFFFAKFMAKFFATCSILKYYLSNMAKHLAGNEQKHCSSCLKPINRISGTQSVSTTASLGCPIIAK